ncbi:MAG: glycosyl transferase group 1 [Ignavibacteria bacterium]|nr:MAG: glycosyl transferase group 1 [Ignavibacteria bacterium]KAF0159928.1 MAG: glycosyl transferase group 1 [Ignavibacteria bacterium]
MYKVLVLAYYYPPMGLSGVQRTLKFTKYMHKFNWQPTVITAGNVAYYAHDLSLLKEAEEAGVEIIRTGAFDVNSLLGAKYKTVNMPKEFLRKLFSKLSKTFFIPDNKNSWSKKAYKAAKNILSTEKFDIIYVSIPPYSQFLTAVKLRAEFDIPLFVDYRDLWYDNHFAFYVTPYHKYKHKKLEYNALRNSDKVVAINRRIKEKILLTYPFLDYEDVIILPHGYDPEDFRQSEVIKRSSGKMKLTYSGIFYENITPEFLLRAFKELTIENPQIASQIELEFIGHLRDENKKLIMELNLSEFVKEQGYLEHSEVVKYLVSTDVLWMMIGNISNADTISTSKLFEYFGTRKPILGCVPDGAARNALLEYGASFIVYPDYVKDIKDTLLEIYKLHKTKSLPVPNEDFVLKHDRLFLAEQLIKEFQFHLRA